MDLQHPPAAQPNRAASRVVLGGILALGVAMGVGRFAFTPLLPLMLRDGSLGIAEGAWWAAANYGGYLAGAVSAAWVAADPLRALRLALPGVALATAAVGGEPGVLAGAVLRAAAGLFSAWALVGASAWCPAELARLGAAERGAWIYCGVGLGISLAGTLAWLGGRQPASWLWLELGLLAAIGAAIARGVLQDSAAHAAPAAVAPRPTAAPAAGQGGDLVLVLCYGAFGFGYIVPATFLPAMARQLVADPLVFGLAWPLFGLAAAVSVAAAARWLPRWPRGRVWALAQGAMALGTAAPLLSRSLWALAASAVMVGGSFMVATMAGLQLARQRRPADSTPLLARMTAAFAAGQIAGPLLIRVLGAGSWAGWDALDWSNAAATAVLAGTAAWLWRQAAAPENCR